MTGKTLLQFLVVIGLLYIAFLSFLYALCR